MIPAVAAAHAKVLRVAAAVLERRYAESTAPWVMYGDDLYCGTEQTTVALERLDHDPEAPYVFDGVPLEEITPFAGDPWIVASAEFIALVSLLGPDLPMILSQTATAIEAGNMTERDAALLSFASRVNGAVARRAVQEADRTRREARHG